MAEFALPLAAADGHLIAPTHPFVHSMFKESSMLKGLTSVVCLFFLGVCVPGHAQDAADDKFVYFYPSIHRISAGNQIQAFQLPENEELFLSTGGRTIPMVSPDNRWIAFIRENDLWLYNTRTRATQRATHVGRPYTKIFASVLALGVTWSADSTKVLINVTPGETECVDCDDRGDWKKRRANYGYFTYNIASGALTRMALPADFDVWDWRADGRLVGTRAFTEDPSPLMVVPGAKPQPVPGLEGRNVLGLSISRDGSWGVAATSEYGTNHIVRVDLRAGTAVALTAEGRFGEYLAPDISPEEAHVSWVHRTGAVNASNNDLVVDGKTVFTSAARVLIYEWLDERRIAVSDGGRVQVIEIGSQTATQ